MMMYKLLAELDFRHFRETGLTVTNLEYKAFPKGPVPEDFQKEITRKNKLVLPPDFVDSLYCDAVEFIGVDGKEYKGFMYRARRKPNLKLFSPRQQKILQQVADIYRDATATEASDASHERGTPWTITIAKKGERATIDLFETLELIKPLTREIAEERLKERQALIYNYGK